MTQHPNRSAPWVLPLLAVVWIVAGCRGPSEAAEAAPTQATRLTSITPRDCQIEQSSDEGDALRYRCPGAGMDVFVTFYDGTRMTVQFGTLGPEFGPYSSSREVGWPVQWVGTDSSGAFRPTAAIFRARRPYEDDGPTFLTVVSLRSAPCLLGETRGAGANAEAMVMATTGQCGSGRVDESPAVDAASYGPDSFPMQFSYRWQGATLVSLAGHGTSNAVARGRVTRQDAVMYCDADPNQDAAARGRDGCIAAVLAREAGRTYTASANCPQGRLTAPWSASYVQGHGEWFDSSTGEEIATLGMVTGAASVPAIFQMLCG